MELFIANFLHDLSTPIIFIISAISLFTLGKGADLLVDEAVNISKKLGIPKAIIGATIVSLGTTLPEASVSVMAAINGNPDLALGNAIGSIIVDTGLIIGVAAMISPIIIDYKSIRFQSWVQIGSGFLIVFLSLPMISGGYIHQWMGFMLVAMLIAYITWSLKKTKTALANAVDEEDHLAASNASVITQLLIMAVGMALVIGASKVLIPSVELIAVRVGIPQSIIAATLVAFGTSLPELTTAIKSVLKGHGDLALGNILGADILNVLFVIGVSASFTPMGLKVPADFFTLQYPALILILGLFRMFTLSKNKVISRVEGGSLIFFYLVYLGLNYLV